jgi:hypothetical protein
VHPFSTLLNKEPNSREYILTVYIHCGKILL